MAKPQALTGPGKGPAQLWRSKAPWKDRPSDTGGAVAAAFLLKTPADRVRSMALGWRPPKGRFSDLEHKAVILGGIDALRSSGSGAWPAVSTAHIPQLKTVNDRTDLALIDLVNSASGKRFSSLEAAANYIRDQAIKYQVKNASWYARGMHLASAAATAQGKRNKAEGGLASGLGAAATATAAFPPAALILGAVGAGVAANAARTKAEETRSQGLLAEFTQNFENSINNATARKQVAELKRKQEMQKAQLEAEAVAEAERNTKLVQGAVWGSLLGSGLLFGYALYRRSRE